MLNLILFGPPGGGKGTQADKLVEKYNLLHISTGDLFRYNLKNETDLGKEAKTYMDKGELVPDSVTIKMLKDKVLQNPDVAGYIFDGFPRTIPQGDALDALMEEMGTSISKLIMLDVPNEELIRRLLSRGKDSGRADDQSVETIQNRLDVYTENTLPVFDHYFKKEKSVKVWGVGSLEMVFDRLCLELDSIK